MHLDSNLQKTMKAISKRYFHRKLTKSTKKTVTIFKESFHLQIQFLGIEQWMIDKSIDQSIMLLYNKNI